MLKPIALATAALGLLAAPVQAEEPAGKTRGETELAKLLEGRVAGEPKRCIRTLGARPLNQIDGTAITYREGNTIWVNYTRNPESIDDDDIMVIKRFGGSSLCRTDHIDLISRTGGFYTGVIFLDEFVPYKRIEDREG